MRRAASAKSTADSPSASGERENAHREFESSCILSDETQTGEKLGRGRPVFPLVSCLMSPKLGRS